VNGSKKSPQRAPTKALDLGLGDIIAPNGGVEPSPVKKIDPAEARGPIARQTEGATKRVTPPQERAAALSEYGALAARGEWAKLMSVTEQRTSGGGHGELAPRFWWVRASVALGSVPLSILAAPLETVTREIAEATKRGGSVDSELVGAASELLVEVSGQLQEKGDHATALSFAERAFRLTGGASDTLARVVARVLSLPEPSARRDPAGVRLRERCRKLGEELGVGATPSQRAEPKIESTPKFVASALQLEKTTDVERSTDSSLRPLLVVLAAAVLGAAGMRFFVGEAPEHGGESTIALLVPEMRPELRAPAIERLSSLSQLDAIFYDFDRGGERRAALTREGAAPAVAPVAQRTGPKEVVNTAGPVEPADVVEALRAPSTKPEDDVGSILFGAPKPRFPGADRGEPRPLPVDRFGAERDYVVITSTRVLTRPSFTGSAVAELRSGDRVRAEGLVGDWLKIRSRNGQVGYILSQDVKAGG